MRFLGLLMKWTTLCVLMTWTSLVVLKTWATLWTTLFKYQRVICGRILVTRPLCRFTIARRSLRPPSVFRSQSPTPIKFTNHKKNWLLKMFRIWNNYTWMSWQQPFGKKRTQSGMSSPKVMVTFPEKKLFCVKINQWEDCWPCTNT